MHRDFYVGHCSDSGEYTERIPFNLRRPPEAGKISLFALIFGSEWSLWSNQALGWGGRGQTTMVVTEVLSTRCFKDIVPFRKGHQLRLQSEEKAGKGQIRNPTFTQKNVGLTNWKCLFYHNILVLWRGALCSNRAGDPFPFLVRSGQMGLWFFISGFTSWGFLEGVSSTWLPQGRPKPWYMKQPHQWWGTLQGSQGKETGEGTGSLKLSKGFLTRWPALQMAVLVAQFST